MLKDNGMDKKYWAEAIKTAAYVRNRIGNEVNKGKSPYEATMKQVPDLSFMRAFGCICCAHVPEQRRSKLDDTSVNCHMLGYGEDQKAYRVMDVNTGNVFSSRSVVFKEEYTKPINNIKFDLTLEEPVRYVRPASNDTSTTVYQKPVTSYVRPASNDTSTTVYQNPVTSTTVYQRSVPSTTVYPNQPPSTTTYQNSATRNTVSNSNDIIMDDVIMEDASYNPITGPSRFKPTVISDTLRDEYVEMVDRHVDKRMAMPDHQLEDGTDVYCLMVDSMDEQATSYEEIMKSEFRDQWKEAMTNEIKSIKSQGTWELKPMPDGKKLVGSRWIFKVKKNADGGIERRKARFCAKGFTQKAGVDFHETYAPVAKMNSIRTILSIVTTEDLELHQADVDTAFLYGEMDTDVYIRQPSGFVEPGKEDWVCHLKKSLYGTKQAARQWYKKVHSTVTKNGFEECQNDNCVYIRRIDSEFSILALYVDDLIIASTTLLGVKIILDFLKCDFSIKELGELNYCLGIKVERIRNERKLFLSQKACIERVIERFGLSECKPCYTPAEVEQLTRNDELSNVKFPYREAVGSMMYLMLCTRPDIANAVGCVAKYCDNYDVSHWTAVKRILRYLQTTKDFRLEFSGEKREKLIC